MNIIKTKYFMKCPACWTSAAARLSAFYDARTPKLWIRSVFDSHLFKLFKRSLDFFELETNLA